LLGEVNDLGFATCTTNQRLKLLIVCLDGGPSSILLNEVAVDADAGCVLEFSHFLWIANACGLD